jgi:hypothetical protein
MTKNILAKGALAVAVVGGLLASTYGCDQPKPKCAAGRGAFIAVYKPVSGPPSCADLKGEKLGFATYNPVGPDEGKPNLNVASIAIESESLGTLVDTAAGAGAADKDPTHKPYGLGFFSTSEPEGDFCVVPTLTVATQSIPEVKADPDNEIEASPATIVSYGWSNVRLYVTSAAQGTQFTADLTLTTDGVACGYKVLGMYPYVDCSKPNPADKKKPLTDEGACAPDADEDAGRPTGSGINPDFPTRCDPDLFACVLTKDVLPALK